MAWKLSTTLAAAVLAIGVYKAWQSGRLKLHLPQTWKHKEAPEPGLFKKHSRFESFTTSSGRTYPCIRVFYHAHPQAAKLPQNLPLLVFVHGLGGNVTQFGPLLKHMSNIAPCLAIDLPGCGQSDFKPRDPKAYTITAFAELLAAAIGCYRNRESDQQVILIGHSMGCSISVLLSSSSSPIRRQLNANYIVGFVAICPRASQLSAQEIAMIGRLRWLPPWLFDILRMFDRRGGLDSRSINRVVGDSADRETRKLQQKFNTLSKSAVFLRIITSTLPSLDNPSAGWPGKDVWSGVEVPLFLIAGEADVITPPGEVEQIEKWLSHSKDNLKDGPISEYTTEADIESAEVISLSSKDVNHTDAKTQANRAHNGVINSGAGPAETIHKHGAKLARMPDGQNVADYALYDTHTSIKHHMAIKTMIFPAPATHSLLYATSTVHVLSGLLETFLSRYVDERLGLGWQLQYLTTSGKWDVKNLAKWQSVDPCSEPIGGVFRAMKTMREVDDVHNPKEFVKRYSSKALPDGVAVVVDISHESPVYDPQGLIDGGVEYRKFPTVSKLPPTCDEVEQFIVLIDHLRASDKMQAQNPWSDVRPTIGVHCHYGFNRTGMLIVSYLVERMEWKLDDALAEFKAKRGPKGINHAHFINELYVRYGVKMKRRMTIVG